MIVNLFHGELNVSKEGATYFLFFNISNFPENIQINGA